MRYVVALLACGLAMPATAQCVGSATFKTCTDSSGNTTTVSRVGNSTMVTGSNARTGSTWNQQTMHGPSMSVTTGTDSDGNSWNATSTRSGTFGTDSDGNSFYAPPPPRRRY